MHDQSAGRTSGRTRTAVSAMCVRALRIAVLKSAGNFPRDGCNDLNAEKLQRVKCFVFTRFGIWACRQFSKCRRGRLGSKISGYGRSAEATVCFAMSGLPPPRKHAPIGGVGTFAGLEHDEFWLVRGLRLPLPSGEVGAPRRVRGYGPSLELCPLTRFAVQIDLSPMGRGERSANGSVQSKLIPAYPDRAGTRLILAPSALSRSSIRS